MKSIRILSMKSEDYPFLVAKSNCLIDENFTQKYCNVYSDENIENQKFESQDNIQSKKNQTGGKVVDIKAIEFEWIFNNNEGEKFMELLANFQNIDLYSLDIVK